MSKHRVAVLKVVSSQLSVTAAAVEYRISRGHLQRLLRRCRDGGLDELEPRSRRPHTSPHGTSYAMRGRIVALRTEVTRAGLDAGPTTIAWHLEREGLPVPSTSTIRRILHATGLVVPELRKRPRSSWIRFEAAAPNEVWQSDFTHWRLADGTEVEIISWLHDHSRWLLACAAFQRVAGDDVVATFTAAGDAHGWPAATLTERGGLHVALHRGAQRLRVPARLARGLRRPISPCCRPSSTPSARSTTSSGRTEQSGAARRPRPMPRGPRPIPPGAAPRATSVSATTPPMARARSPCAEPAACTTSRSVRPTPVGASWRSRTSRRSPSSPSIR